MKKLKGTGSAMLSAVIYGVNPMMAKVAYDNGSTEAAVILYSSLAVVPILIVILLAMKTPLLPKRKDIKSIFMLCFFQAVTTILLYASYNFTATGIATTMHFTYPTLVAIGGILFFKQKLTKKKMAALVFSLIGIALAADFAGVGSIKGIVLALASGVTYTAYILTMDYGGLKDKNIFSLCLYMSVGKVIATAIYGTATKSLNVHMNITAWEMILLLGISASIGATVLFQIGIRYIGSCNAAIFSMFEPVTSLAVGFWFMSEAMTAFKLIGCVLILSGIILTSLDNRTVMESV